MGSTKANKAKGRKGQQEVRDMILEAFPELEMDDCRSTSMGAQGADILLSPIARSYMPWNIEVKRRKRIGLCRHIEQAAEFGEDEPVVFAREDRGEWIVALRAEYFLDLFGTAEDEEDDGLEIILGDDEEVLDDSSSISSLGYSHDAHRKALKIAQQKKDPNST